MICFQIFVDYNIDVIIVDKDGCFFVDYVYVVGQIGCVCYLVMEELCWLFF